MIDRPVLHYAAQDEWLEPCPCCGLCSWAGAFLLDTKQYVCLWCVKWIEENEQWRKSSCAPNANTT